MVQHIINSPKYSVAERKRVRKRIKQLRREGLHNALIAERLNSEGIRKPDGKECDKVFVANQVHRILKLGKRLASGRAKWQAPRVRQGQAVLKPAALRAPELALSILTDPKLSAEKKLALITAYYE